ncbi:MAG: dTMP kinase [Patescibacteria group bacterium]|nr:dTMP kinase [Patescibacteria group bacterium]
MIKNDFPGLFIDIEGLDGGGSSTQCSLVGDFFKSEGIKVFTTKEPTNNVIGGLIRGVLTNTLCLSSDALQLLYAADRAHHLNREIIPMLKSKNIVITDRYAWSSLAFGSIDLDGDWILGLNKNFICPDISIFVKVSPEICITRIKKDRFDVELFEEEKKLIKVWQTYEFLHQKFPQLIKVVNGERSKELVKKEIIDIVQKHPKYRLFKGG